MNIEKGLVHYIGTNNNHVARKKDIIHIIYNNYDIYILDEDKNEYSSGVLYRDSSGEFWMFCNLYIDYERFDKVINKQLTEYDRDDYIRYCDFKSNEVKSQFDNFLNIAKGRMSANKYFNIIELAYLEKDYPELYPEALKSREICLKKRQEEREKDRQAEESRKKNIVKTKNKEFLDKIITTKVAIHEGKKVLSETLEYYKDDNYYQKTQQNNFLYLFKEYEINVPLSTQGFINNKLYSYNFNTGESQSYGGYKGNTLYVSMDKLKEEIDKEYSINKELNEPELDIV